MKRALVLLLACSCASVSRPKLIQQLRDEREELESSDQSGYPYRAPTPDVGALRGATHRELDDALGSGSCWPEGAGQRCTWPFYAGVPSGKQLRVSFDSNGQVTDAAWEPVP